MKRETYLKSLLAFLLLMVGAAPTWAEDEVITLTSSKDGLVRTKTGSDSDASKNFDGKNGNGMIIMNNLPDDDTKNKFVGLMGFDLSSVKTKVNAGYTISKVALRVTNIKNDTYTLNIYKYGDSWEENTITWATSDHATYIAQGTLGTLQTKSYNGKTVFEVAQGSVQANPYDIANRQSTLEVTEGDLFDYIVAAVTNGAVSFCLTNNNATETQLFSKDVSETNWSNATTKSYTWDESASAWAEETGVNISRYAAVMRYFGLTDADVTTQLCPQLTITLAPPAAPSSVYNVTTGTGYASLNEAFAALTDADTELQVNEDQTLTGRLTWSKAHTLTITPKKDITIKGHKNGMWFLANTNDGVLNIGSSDYTITLDGENSAFEYDVTKYENSATIALTNVVFQNFDLNNVGHLVGSKANEGQIILDKVTFKNCKNPANAFIDKQRVTNDRLVLKGYLNIDSDCTGTAVYAASETKDSGTTGRIKVDDSGFTASNPITIEWPGTKSEGIVVVIGTSESNASLFKLTDNDWDLTRKSNGDLVLAEAATPTYTITDNSGEGGSLSFSPASPVTSGTEVTITVTPESGKQLKEGTLSAKDATEAVVTITDNKFTMPASNVTVTAEFEDVVTPPSNYTVTQSTATNGSYALTVGGEAAATEIAEGATVTITITPDTGYEVDEVTVVKTDDPSTTVEVSGTASPYTFTMPAYGVTVTVTFKAQTATGNVVNKTTGVSYATLAEAFTAAVEAGTDAELEVNEDQTLSSRLTWTKAATLTITPKKDITIKGHKNGMWFLANTNDGVLNIGSSDYTITLDGENSAFEYDVTKYENSATIALTNVVFQNFDLNNVGHLVGSKANEGQIILDKVTFKNCKNPANAFIDKQRVTNDRLVLKGYLNIDSDCTGTAVYAASETKDSGTTGRIKVDDAGFTASNPITIEWPGTKADNIVVVIGTSESNAGLFKLTGTGWDLSRKSNGDLVMAAATVTTYTVSIADGITNGSIGVDKTSAAEGETVTVNTITPDAGYQLESLTYTPEGGTATDITETKSFTMPASNVTVNAVFSVSTPSTPTVTFNSEVKDASDNVIGTFAVKNGETTLSDLAEVTSGTSLTIVTSPAAGYEVDAISIKKTDNTEVEYTKTADNTYTFNMPDVSVGISVTFKAQTTIDYTKTFKVDGVGSWPTLTEALSALTTSGETILVQNDAVTTMDSRIKFGGSDGYQATVTIKAADGVTYTIERGTQNGVLFNWGGNGTVTFENVVFDEKESTQGPLFETDGGSRSYVFNNVTFKNSKSSNAVGLFNLKNGQMTFNNVTLDACTVSNAFIRTAVATGGITFTGTFTVNANCSGDFLRLASGVTLDATALPTMDSYKIEIEDNTPVITNVADETAAGKFTLATLGYVKSYDSENKKITFSEDNTGAFKIEGATGTYPTLQDAINAASDGQTIQVNTGSVTLDAAVTLDKAVSIVPTQALTIKRGTSLAKDAVLFSLATSKNVTIGSNDYALTIDGQGSSLEESPTEKLIQVTAGTLTLVNTTITNAKTTANQGVICAKNNGKITLNGVTFTDCTVPSGKGVVFVGKDEGLTLSGNNVFNGNGIYVEKALKIVDSGTTHTSAISIIVEDANRTAAGVVVSGTSDVSKYTLVSNSWELAADTENNNLVIAEKSYDYSKTFKVEGVGSFDTLAEALAGLTTSNQTILVQSDAVTKMDSRIKFGGSDGYQATVTIKAADGVTYTIERGTQNGVLFNWGGNGTVTFENVVFDEKESTQGPLFETDGGSRSYVFNNVTFKNSKSSNAVGLFNLKNGQMTFNNVTLDACTVSNAFIRTAVATGGITFTGTFTVNANCSGDFLRLASGVTLDATALPTMDSYTIEIEDGTPVITNVTDESKFTLMTDTYMKSFDAETKVISFTEKTFDYTKTFKVESVGSFDTLKEALDSESVTDGATIIVQATEMTLEAQTAFNKSVAIVPDGDALTIKRATTLTGETDAVLFSLATAEKTVTIGGEGKTVTIDGQGTASSKALAEVTNGTLKFVNTTIKDVVTSNNQGVLCAKNSGTISLNNVTFSDCQATADKAGVVFCGRNDAIKLEGAISFTGGSGYNFFLEKRLRVMNTLTATGLTLFAKEAEGGVVTTLANSLAVVYENGSYYSADHFALQNAGYTMELQTNGKDVALVAKSFGITIASGIANGSVSVDATDATTVAVGTEVTITATPDAGFKLKAGSLVATYGSENTVVTITDNKFKMPAGDVTISAVFESTVVVTTPQTITVKDRMNVNGATRKYADNSKSVASTNANNSIWYLGDVDMSKVHSITIKGAAFVNGTINDVDTKAQLKLGYLAAGTISSVSADELSANSGTIRDASNHLMAQLTAQTIPTAVADGSDATNYAGADFEITADGVTQTGTYDGSVTIDTENTKGLQKTDAVYQLFLYGTAQSRRLAVDEVIINFEGNSVPEGAYADNTYEEPMTNVGQDTEVIGEPAAGYTKATLAASADTYLRKGNADNNGAKPQMEVYTYTNAESDPAVDKDFVGLLSFDLPIRAKSAGAEIQKVQLRLVGKRLKGGRNMNIYGFGSDFEESAKYADLESAVTAAREAGAIHSYETRGQAGLDVETNYESLTSYNATIAGWTNYFDLTSYVQGLSDTKVRLMIASPDNSDNQKIYYTKEAADISNDVMTVAAADLVPQLIIVYKEGENLLSVSHPAMLHTAVDIARVKSNLGISPVREAFEHLQGSNYAQSSYTAQPVEYLKRMDAANWGPDGTYGQNADYNNYTYAMRDANAAYQLALRYQLEGSTDCADAAVKILNDWTTTNKGLYKITDAGWANDIPDPNEYLILIQGHQFANAAELLRDYSGWSSTDFTAFKSWMKSTFSDNAMVFLQNHHGHTADKHYWLNWDLAALTSVLSVGILCDDKNLTDYAINYYKGTAVTTTGHTSAEEVGYYQNAIPYIYNEDGTIGLGQCQESGRDQGHSLLDVALLGAFCQMAKNMGSEGADLFAVDDYRAVKMAEYVGKYNLGNDVDFTAYNPNTEYNHTAISAEGRGGVRPVWELFYRYARENGKTAKYAQQWAEKLRADNAWGEGGAGDYGTESTGFDQLGYGTLMYADGPKLFTVGDEGFATLDKALETVADGGTILVTGDATVDSQVSFSKSVTIKSDGETARTLKRGVDDKVLYLMGSNKTVTFENIIFDENNATAKPLLEVNNSQKFVLKDVTIKNAKYAGSDGLLDVKNGTLTLNGVTFKDCALTNTYIRTAKADGGGLDLTNVTFSNSTGNHIRLRANASIDGAAVLNAITAPVKIEINGADYEKLSITNVTDLSKFELMTDGYEMKLTDGTVTFVKESDGQDTDDLTKYDGTTSTRTPEADTFVRSTSADTKYGSANNIEVHTNAAGDADFAGLLSFRLPGNAVAEGAEIQKVQLRLVTKQKKSSGGINIFKFGDFTESDATYTTTSEAITAARKTDAIAKFYPNGQYNMDVASDGTKEAFSDDYKKLSAWENRIDLTSYVKGLGSQTVNLLLSASANDGQAIQFFSKEWTTDLSTAAASDGTPSTNAFDAAASDLVPQLIVIYKGTTTTNTFVIEGEGSYAKLEEAMENVADGGTILVTTDATIDSQVSFSKSVTIKPNGETARTLKRGVDDKVLYLMGSNKTVTFENIIFDENNATAKPLLEVNNSQKFVLKDVTIQNAKYAGSDGLLDVKNGTLTLNAVTFKDCALTNAYIRTAKANGGGLDLANVTFSNSTGNHIRLRANASIDGAAVLNAITAPVKIEINGADYEKLSITNVTDLSKFQLMNDGYEMVLNNGTVTFTKESDGQDTDDLTKYDGTTSTRTPEADTFVRSTSADTKYGSANNIEVHTNAAGDADFAGLLSFRLPGNAVAEGAEIQKVQLRLVTKQKKSTNGINIFKIGDFTEADTYTTMKDAVEAARQTSAIAKFYPNGQNNMDVTADGEKEAFSDDYRKLSAWENRIDLTSYVKSLGSKTVNLLLSAAVKDGQTIQFFSKDWTTDLAKAGTRAAGNAFSAAASDLVPQLIVIYKGTATTNTFVIEGEGSYATLHEALAEVADGGTILVTENARIDSLVAFNKNVTIKPDGSTARKMTRGSSASSILYKMDKSVTVTFENMILDENGFESRPMMEVNTNQHFVLKDVTIQNSRYTGADGLIDVKNGTLTLNGVTFMDNELKNAHIRTAKADGGGLDFAGRVTFSNSKGSHIRLRASASIDGGAVLRGITAPITIEINEADYAKLSITNVSDDSKFELVTLGYEMRYDSGSGTITFVEEPDGQDSKSIDVPEGALKEAITTLGDTYVRKGNTGDNGKKTNMEVYTYKDSESDLDFVGMLSFKLPTDLTKEGAKLYKAQLRLVGKRVKGSRVVDMYTFYRDFDESATYNQVNSIIDELRNGGRLHRFHAMGQAGMDIEADVAKLSDDYKNIEAWTNRIDLTGLVSEAMHDDGKVRLALMSPLNSKDAKMFYTKEATGISNSEMNVDADELVPQLILVYDPGMGESTLTAKNIEATPNADTFVRKGSSSDNSVSTAIEVYTYQNENQDIDFVGLLSFNLDAEVQAARTRAQKDTLEVFSATLRLVSKRVRGEKNMNLYAFDKTFSNKSTYSELETSIQETRESGKKVSFVMAGQDGKDITTDSGLTGNYKTSITAWTNEIDLSSLIKDSNANTLRLMISAADNGRNSKQFFSSEAESFTNDNNKDFIVAEENLWPLLTISFRNPMYTDIEETIVIPVSEERIYDLRGNRVQSMGKGVYIVNGKKVLKK